MARPRKMVGMKPSKGGAYSAKNVRPFRVESDPVVAADAPCIVDGRERPPIAAAHGDPFCGRKCCELYYSGESTAADRVTREAVA